MKLLRIILAIAAHGMMLVYLMIYLALETFFECIENKRRNRGRQSK